MDKLYLKDIEIFAKHGVFQEEKTLGQKFILSLELSLDTRKAAKTNDLALSVHYGELCHNVEAEFQKESYDLIETAAEKIAEYILLNYDLVKGVKVLLKKPWAPIARHLDYAAIEIYRKWSRVFLSIGTNIGDKEKNINDALELLTENKDIKIVNTSSYIKTEPWGVTDQEEFLNCAIEIKTILSSRELLEKLQGIESKMKRERILRWGPRIIDLDIIFFNDEVNNEEDLIIPHPRMEERDFVLRPINEIAPNMLHPILGKRVWKLLEELENDK